MFCSRRSGAFSCGSWCGRRPRATTTPRTTKNRLVPCCRRPTAPRRATISFLKRLAQQIEPRQQLKRSPREEGGEGDAGDRRARTPARREERAPAKRQQQRDRRQRREEIAPLLDRLAARLVVGVQQWKQCARDDQEQQQ